MFSNLLGFDVEAELRCAKTRRWIKQEEKRVERMNREYDTEDDDLDENEDGKSVNLMEVFHKAIEKLNRENREKNSEKQIG